MLWKKENKFPLICVAYVAAEVANALGKTFMFFTFLLLLVLMVSTQCRLPLLFLSCVWSLLSVVFLYSTCPVYGPYLMSSSYTLPVLCMVSLLVLMVHTGCRLPILFLSCVWSLLSVVFLYSSCPLYGPYLMSSSYTLPVLCMVLT